MRWLVWLMLFPVTMLAEPKVKQASGSIIRGKGKIQTGSSSRIELELPFLAIVRIGSNADFKFSPDAKTMSLESGTMLLAVPERVEGISIESGSIVTSLVKGDLQMANVGGQVKVIVLNGKVFTAMAANKSDRRTMRAGDMVTVPAGATQMPPVTAIKLSTMLKTSILFNMGPLPTSKAIQQNATKQAPPSLPFFVTGGFDPDWGGSGGGSLLSTIGPAGTAAMIARMEQGRMPLPPVLAPGIVPTALQITEFESAGVDIPRSNQRALQQNQGRPATVPDQTPRPQMTPQPQPTRTPITRPDRPNQGLPTPRPRPPIFRPPIAPP